MRNQGVLLRGVNATAKDLLELCFTLLDHAQDPAVLLLHVRHDPQLRALADVGAEAQQLQHDIMGYMPGFATPRIVCDVPFVGKRWVHQVARVRPRAGHLLLDQELPDRHRAGRPRGAHPAVRVLRPGRTPCPSRASSTGASRPASAAALRCTDAASLARAGPLPRALSPDAEWGDWRWQMRHAVRTPEELARRVPLTEDERARLRGDRGGVPAGDLALLPVADRPGASRSARCGCRRSPPGPRRGCARASCAIRSGRTRTRPVAAIVHKYPDRVLFLALDTLLGLLPPLHAPAHHQGGEAELGREALGGGHRLRARAPRGPRRADLGRRPAAARRTSGSRSCSPPLRAIPHVEMIRIGTRVPVTPADAGDRGAGATCSAGTRRSSW